MGVAFHGNNYVINTQKAFLKIPGFTIVYVLGLYIISWQSVVKSVQTFCLKVNQNFGLSGLQAFLLF